VVLRLKAELEARLVHYKHGPPSEMPSERLGAPQNRYLPKTFNIPQKETMAPITYQEYLCTLCDAIDVVS
jgi:hypothetical protein